MISAMACLTDFFFISDFLGLDWFGLSREYGAFSYVFLGGTFKNIYAAKKPKRTIPTRDSRIKL